MSANPFFYYNVKNSSTTSLIAIFPLYIVTLFDNTTSITAIITRISGIIAKFFWISRIINKTSGTAVEKFLPETFETAADEISDIVIDDDVETKIATTIVVIINITTTETVTIFLKIRLIQFC